MLSADLTRPLCRRGCPSRARPPWQAGNASGNSSPVLSGSFSGVARGESPLSLTASQPGHYDSQACELDIQAATRGEVQKKTGGQWEAVILAISGVIGGLPGAGEGKHMGRGQQLLTEAENYPTTSDFRCLDSGCPTLLNPMSDQPAGFG